MLFDLFKNVKQNSGSEDSVGSDKYATFLQFSQAVHKKSQFQSVEFLDVNPDQIRMCSELFKGKSITTVDFREEDEQKSKDPAY